MGVTNLWQILSPVQEHQSLASLEGLVLAVDLSIWICESDGVKQMQGVVTKPHLRNLFFRILHLTQIGVKLVFVIEGTAPELKWEVMAKRQQSRFPGRQGKQTAAPKPPTKQARRHFNAILKECCELLDILGIPYLQSKGEAEALCALLNSSGLVDGCLTDDGDAFLYGAQTVYKNFTMNAKDPHVERYRVTDIENHLGIDRHGLVALALLLGCDFVPKGVCGIGMANALKLLECLKGRDVLERLQDWRKIHESQCIDPTEKMVRRKALNAPDFPQIEVINEFLQPKDKCPSRLSQWKRPVPIKLQEFTLAKLEWPVEYTMEKILPLVTLWDMQDIVKSRNPSKHQHLQAHRIVKTRVRQGVPCYEIEWIKPVTDPYHDEDYYVTIENQELFSMCYPLVVSDFNGETNKKNKKKKAKKKKAKEKIKDNNNQSTVENLSFNFRHLNIKSVTRKLQESLHELHPSFTDYENTNLTTKVKQSSIAQTSSKSNGAPNTGEHNVNFNCGSSREGKHNQVVTPHHRNKAVDETELPFTERVQLRLRKKKQKQNAEADVEAVSQGLQNLSLAGTLTASKRKRKKNNKSNKNTDSDADSSRHSQVNNAVRTITSMQSPVSPFVHSSVLSTNSVRNTDTRKMSSPASHTFCSPASYIKQSVQYDGVFKDSPIQQHFTPDQSSRKQQTMSTNFRFFDTPEPVRRPALVPPTSVTSANTMTHNDTGKPSAASMLKGIWQTEYMDNYISELSKDFSLGPNGTLQYNKPSNTSVNQVLQNKLNLTPNGQRHATESSGTSHRMTHAPEMDKTQDVNFGDFELQSSLLNSLCASLIQTLTPKGMNKEQYESLCESLKKMEQLDEDLKTSETDDVACNIDFAEVEEISSKMKNTLTKNTKNMKPIDLNGSTSRRNSNVSSSSGSLLTMEGLGKSARKRLKRKQRKSVGLTSHSGNEGKTMGTNCEANRNHDSSNFHRQVGSSINKSQNNGNICQGKVAMKQPNKTVCSSKGAKDSDICTDIPRGCNRQQLGSVKELSTSSNAESGLSVDSENSINKENKKKRKNKKKKIVKASAQMDLSVDTSVLNESQYKTCSEYLKKALQGQANLNSQKGKIEKASPIMDLSDDDTILELEALSSCLSGKDTSAGADAKRKLALKKKLSKRQSVNDHATDKYGTITGPDTLSETLPKAPVFSLSYAVEMSCKENGLTEDVVGIANGDEADSIESETEFESGNKSEHDNARTGFDLKEDERKQTECGDSLEINGEILRDGNFKTMRNMSPYKVNSVVCSPNGKRAPVSPKTPKNHNSKFCEKLSYSASKQCLTITSPVRDSSLDTSDIQDITAEQVFAQQHKTRTSPYCCKLDFSTLSNDFSKSDVYERNIQSCKDLRSWSVLPNRSTSDQQQKVKRAKKSVRLHSDFSKYNLHRHGESKKPQLTSRVDQMYNNILGCPVENGHKEPNNTGNDIIVTGVEDTWVGSCKSETNHGNGDTAEHDFEIIDFDIDDDDDNDSEHKLDTISLDNGRDDCGTSLNNVNESSWVDINDKVDITDDINGKVDITDDINGKVDITDDINGKVDITEDTMQDDSSEKIYSKEVDTALNDTEANCAKNGTLTRDAVEEIDEISSTNDKDDNNEYLCSSFSRGRYNAASGAVCNKETAVIEISEINFFEPLPNGTHADLSFTPYAVDEDIETVERKIESLKENKTEVKMNGDSFESCGEFTVVDPSSNGNSETHESNDAQSVLEGSSDKENDTVMEIGQGETNLLNGNVTNNCKEEPVNTAPSSSSKTADGTPVARSSSPIPLLDRLKMKFKKSSARSVLHSFTNGR